MGFALSHVGAGTPFLHRLRLATNLVLTGGRAICGAALDVLTDLDAVAELGALVEAEPGLRH